MKTRLAMLAVAAAAMLCTSCEKKEFWEMSPSDIWNISFEEASAQEMNAFMTDMQNGIIVITGGSSYIFKDGECIFRPGDLYGGGGVSRIVFGNDGMVYDFWESDIPDYGPGCSEYRMSLSDGSSAAMTFESIISGERQTATLNRYEDGNYIITGELPGSISNEGTRRITTGSIVFDSGLRNELIESLDK